MQAPSSRNNFKNTTDGSHLIDPNIIIDIMDEYETTIPEGRIPASFRITVLILFENFEPFECFLFLTYLLMCPNFRDIGLH